LLKAVKRCRPQAHLEVEVLSSRLRALPSAVAAARLAAGVDSCLAAAGWERRAGNGPPV
jgi:hypothetical protein